MAPFVRKVAREFSHMVIGPEVIEESRNAVVIQDLSDTAELSAEKCLRRMHLIVRAMHEDALEALRTHDEALARDVAQRDQDVDRLYWMVAKQYNIAHTAGAAPPHPSHDQAQSRSHRPLPHGHHGDRNRQLRVPVYVNSIGLCRIRADTLSPTDEVY